MDPIRIACVRYLNTIPLVEGLGKLAGIELIPTVPSRIAAMLRAGEADVGLASVFDAAATPSDGPESRPALALLPVGMIGCDGPTMTVRLFSAVPFERIAVLHADTDSRTSVALAQILLKRCHGAEPRVAPWREQGSGRRAQGSGTGDQGSGRRDQAPSPQASSPESSSPEPSPQALLLIGDKVVTAAPPPERFPHQLDLGEAWKAWTGLPFVYAMWMCRADEADSPRVRLAAAVLDRQRRHNRTRLDWIVSQRAAAHGWPEPLARRYVGDYLRFEVGPRQRQAVARFLGEAASMGLAAAASPVWADAAAPGAPEANAAALV